MRTGSSRRHIVVATDESFAMPTAVTLRSIGLAGGPAHVSVLHDSISRTARDRIRSSVPGDELELDFVDMGEFDVGASRASHLPTATYFRLLIADVVPPGASTVLYLDVDTIVRHDLGELFAVRLDGNSVGAVRSVHFPFVGTRGAVNHWRDLGLEPATPFFNAGVLLIDLDRWRTDEVASRALDHLRSPHLGGGADQEALNVALRGSWTPLAARWNQQTPMLADDHGADLIFESADLARARVDPSIVHFQTRPKPWHRGADHPWRAEWSSCAAGVAFDRTSNLPQRSLRAEARWRIKRAASALVRGR